MIKWTVNKFHWNYFLALEQDLEATSRYIEFCDANLKVFSIVRRVRSPTKYNDAAKF